MNNLKGIPKSIRQKVTARMKGVLARFLHQRQQHMLWEIGIRDSIAHDLMHLKEYYDE